MFLGQGGKSAYVSFFLRLSNTAILTLEDAMAWFGFDVRLRLSNGSRSKFLRILRQESRRKSVEEVQSRKPGGGTAILLWTIRSPSRKGAAGRKRGSAGMKTGKNSQTTGRKVNSEGKTSDRDKVKPGTLQKFFITAAGGQQAAAGIGRRGNVD